MAVDIRDLRRAVVTVVLMGPFYDPGTGSVLESSVRCIAYKPRI